LRARQQRNLLLTLLLSQGVPMICGGDEIGRTQAGNNNAYAQDNEIAWHHWKLSAAQQSLLDFTKLLLRIRKEHPNFHRRKFFQDRGINPGKARRGQSRRRHDIAWLRPDGQEMTVAEWNAGWIRCIGLFLSGARLDDETGAGEPLRDDDFVLLLNPHHEAIRFCLPKQKLPMTWELLIDTSQEAPQDVRLTEESYELTPQSAALLRNARSHPKAV
jgi:glycogen operon protein